MTLRVRGLSGEPLSKTLPDHPMRAAEDDAHAPQHVSLRPPKLR